MNDSWVSTVKNSINPKVLLMLSGGKDSIAAMTKMIEEGIDVHAIHFVHDWGERIPTEEAERTCDLLGVELIKYNFSKEFHDTVIGYTNGRPCLLCKRTMYECLVSYLTVNKYGWLAIGDNANDTTTIARMNRFKNPFGDNNLICSDYFGSEMGCKLPKGMHVLRPLIHMTAEEVEHYLENKNIKVKRIQSTGDKYFEYHREGCPIQFADVGVKIDDDLLENLKEYNSAITVFARNKGIRASVHLPSTFIITIPTGYENEAAEYLKNNGLYVSDIANSANQDDVRVFFGWAKLINGDYFRYESNKKSFERFVERMGLQYQEKTEMINQNVYLYRVLNDQETLTMLFDEQKNIVQVIFETYSERYNIDKISNLVMEIFRTRNCSVKQM